MTSDEHRQVVDVAKVVVNEYFDHYLTDVFPKTMDRMFASHNVSEEAHPTQFAVVDQTKTRVDRIKWMIAGGSAVVGFVGGLLATHWSQIFKIFAG